MLLDVHSTFRRGSPFGRVANQILELSSYPARRERFEYQSVFLCHTVRTDERSPLETPVWNNPAGTASLRRGSPEREVSPFKIAITSENAK